VRKKQKELSW